MIPSNHIRILDLLPSGRDDLDTPIKCVTRIVALSDNPDYEALSYRWGSDKDRRLITIGSQPTSVTPNLCAALLRLRLHNEKRSLWIDQICINQEDTDEKASQIRLMGHIYSHCTRCVVWLGEIDTSITLDDAKGGLVFCACMANENLLLESHFRGLDGVLEAMKALRSICPDEHQWWQRVWTVQEIILPPSKTFIWGPLEFDWETLDQWASSRRGLVIRKGSRAGPIAAGKQETEINRISHESLELLRCNVLWIDEANKGDDPITTVIKWRRRRATDPRDKVFGLLGLFPSNMAMPHTDQCDYKTHTGQVYCAFSLDVILHTETLDSLIIEPRAPAGDGTVGLSRWATDMNCISGYFVDMYWRIWGCGKGRYDACAGRKPDMAALLKAAAVPELHMRVLGLTGVMVDTIEIVGTGILVSPQVPTFEEIATVLRSWMEMARRFQKSLGSASDGDKFENAFYRVLVGDFIRNGNQGIERRPTKEDLAAVSGFVRTGSGLINGLSFWPKYVGNQTFFITKGGIMGMGHWETEPGDEVWIFEGGAMPFTMRPRKGRSSEDFDFVGCCYAQNIMEGEVYIDEQVLALRRTVQVY